MGSDWIGLDGMIFGKLWWGKWEEDCIVVSFRGD